MSVLVTLLATSAGVLFAESGFFDTDGVWDTAGGREQLLIGLIVAVVFAVSVGVTSTFLALLLSFSSRRWQQEFWKPMLKRLLKYLKRVLPYTVVHRGTFEELKSRPELQEPRETNRTPVKGITISAPTGKVSYGDLYTRSNMNDKTLRVYWNNGHGIGTLSPSKGNGWDVVYGLFEGSVQNEFRPIAPLGRADSRRDGVEMLRKRDLTDL